MCTLIIDLKWIYKCMYDYRCLNLLVISATIITINTAITTNPHPIEIAAIIPADNLLEPEFCDSVMTILYQQHHEHHINLSITYTVVFTGFYCSFQNWAEYVYCILQHFSTTCTCHSIINLLLFEGEASICSCRSLRGISQCSVILAL